MISIAFSKCTNADDHVWRDRRVRPGPDLPARRGRCRALLRVKGRSTYYEHSKNVGHCKGLFLIICKLKEKSAFCTPVYMWAKRQAKVRLYHIYCVSQNSLNIFLSASVQDNIQGLLTRPVFAQYAYIF